MSGQATPSQKVSSRFERISLRSLAKDFVNLTNWMTDHKVNSYLEDELSSENDRGLFQTIED